MRQLAGRDGLVERILRGFQAADRVAAAATDGCDGLHGRADGLKHRLRIEERPRMAQQQHQRRIVPFQPGGLTEGLRRLANARERLSAGGWLIGLRAVLGTEGGGQETKYRVIAKRKRDAAALQQAAQLFLAAAPQQHLLQRIVARQGGIALQLLRLAQVARHHACQVILQFVQPRNLLKGFARHQRQQTAHREEVDYAHHHRQRDGGQHGQRKQRQKTAVEGGKAVVDALRVIPVGIAQGQNGRGFGGYRQAGIIRQRRFAVAVMI